MTEDNRRENIVAAWSRVGMSLEAARVLLAARLFGDSVGRAYYAVFHAASCLLLTLGLEPRSHRGLIQLFNQHFVRTGRVPDDFGRLLSQMQTFREEADDDPFAVFDERAAREELTKAERFVGAAERLLRTEGWLLAGSAS